MQATIAQALADLGARPQRIEETLLGVADVVLVVDRDDVICDTACALDAGACRAIAALRGNPASSALAVQPPEAVRDAIESSRKGANTCLDASHPLTEERTLSVHYTLVDLADEDKLVFLGRDRGPELRARATLTTAARVPAASSYYAELFALSGDADDDPDRLKLRVLQRGPDAVVLVDLAGSVVWANEAFQALAARAGADAPRGRDIDDCLHGLGPRFRDWLKALERHSELRGLDLEIGGETDTAVATSATAFLVGRAPRRVLALVLREANTPADTGTAERAVAMLGAVPLPQLVEQTAHEIERDVIEAALSLTGNNRSAAARILGLSRQALYDKLHRLQLH